MHRDPRLYLDDILEALARVQEYTTSMDYENLNFFLRKFEKERCFGMF